MSLGLRLFVGIKARQILTRNYGVQSMNKVQTEAVIRGMLEERGSRYGDFSDVAGCSQGLKAVMIQTPHWFDLSDVQREALEAVAAKISRILSGDFEYRDSWQDMVGYVTLVLDRLPDRDNGNS